MTDQMVTSMFIAMSGEIREPSKMRVMRSVRKKNTKNLVLRRATFL